MRYVVIDTGKGFELHKVGCPDVRKKPGERFFYSTESADKAVKEFVDPEMQDLGYSTSDVRILPCAV